MVSSRKPWVGGNWKCNGSMSSIAVLFETLNKCEFNSDKVGKEVSHYTVNYMSYTLSFSQMLLSVLPLCI